MLPIEWFDWRKLVDPNQDRTPIRSIQKTVTYRDELYSKSKIQYVHRWKYHKRNWRKAFHSR